MSSAGATGRDLDRLSRVLSSGPESPVTVRACRRRLSSYATSHRLDELDVELADGTVTRLIEKRYQPAGEQTGSGHASSSKPAFVTHPLREVLAYQTVLEPQSLGAARFYGLLGSDGDGPDSSASILLERVDGRELYQVGELEAWEAAAAWLGGLHARFQGRAEELLRSIPLLTQDRALHLRWLARARRFAHKDAARSQRLAALREPYRHAADVLAGQPRTLLHGEFYASNVLVQESSNGNSGRGWRVRPVDCELAGIDAGVLDLAALVAGEWTEEQRGRLTGAYRGGWHAATPPAQAALAGALEAGRLVVAMQWLGWKRRWSPPPDHSQDWLEVAEDAARHL